MEYYEILRKRRQDLGLSIQDVSAQTRLAPEYIKAIEENDLDVFSDDLSFVRYFIQSYCQALGVNWEAVQPEVEGSIKHYAHMRNMALTQAQKRMVEQMPAATNESRVRLQPGSYQSHVTKTSRSLSKKPRRKVSRQALVLLVVLVLGFAGVSAGMNQMSARRTESEQEAARQEALDKEEETKRLAELRRQEQSPADKEDGQDENVSVAVAENQAVLTVNDFSNPVDVTVRSEMPYEMSVWLTENGEVLNDPSVAGTAFEQTVQVPASTVLLFQPADPADVKVMVNGTEVPLAGDGLVTITVIGKDVSDESAQ